MSSESSPGLDGTLGALEIGVVVAIFLYGLQTLQTFNYYRDFPKDKWILKIMVGAVWFLELGHTICACHALYSATVKFYGQLQHIAEPPLSLILTSLFSPAIITIVQRFRKSLTLEWANLGLLVELLKHDSFSFGVENLKWLILFIYSIGLAAELIIPISFCYCLWRVRNEGLKQTNRIVDTIIIWTIETTVITSLGGATMLILFLARDDLYCFIFYLVLAKLFSNSLLVSLNGRKRFRSLHQPHTNPDNSPVIALGSARPSKNTDIFIDMQRISDAENDIGTSTNLKSNGPF
ncbi:hypothetical protein C8R44DRAFT_976197 [Mycena epipterygia]|nr:hypothetical protein C8R44DRAFT_976197 [Mycena epipterygia]